MRRRLMLSAAIVIGFAGSAVPALAQAKLDAQYSVFLTGIPIGKGSLVLNLTDAGYAAAGSAKFTGLLRMVSKGEGTSTVQGTFAGSKLASSVYAMNSNSTDRSEKVNITVANGAVKNYSVTPPPKDLNTNRVPILDAHMKNVVDPMSAALVLAATTGDVLNPESCNRTLPIFDARYRYDVVLSYTRTENAPKKIDGYSGPVLVCQARYVPVSGHRTDRPQVKQMADNRDLFIWLAPVEGTRALVPIKVSISTMLGTMVVEATRFKVEPGKQAAQPAR